MSAFGGNTDIPFQGRQDRFCALTQSRHRGGGTYSYEIAKAKATQVVAFAREHRHPLQCVIERKR
jgi:ATP-dependent Clp protease adapter protein ClpS